MPHSTKSRRAAKPRPDFPLFPHATGRWAKKVQGSLLYFGPTKGDLRGNKAVKVWLAEKDYCLAHGRRPPKTTGKLTVADLVNRVLNAKAVKIDNANYRSTPFAPGIKLGQCWSGTSVKIATSIRWGPMTSNRSFGRKLR